MKTIDTPWINIFRLFPDCTVTVAKVRSEADRIKTEFFEAGRQNCTGDEIVFYLAIEEAIDILERAKSLLANNRFTVTYKTPNDDLVHLENFEVIPIQKREEQSDGSKY